MENRSRFALFGVLCDFKAGFRCFSKDGQIASALCQILIIIVSAGTGTFLGRLPVSPTICC